MSIVGIRKTSIVCLLFIVGCASVTTPASTPTIQRLAPVSTPTTRAGPAPTTTAYPSMDCGEEGYYVFWFVGLGMQGVDQNRMINALTDKYYGARPERDLSMCAESVPATQAADTLFVQFASGNPPGLIGPVDQWDMADIEDKITRAPYDHSGQSWLDLAPLIEQSSTGAVLRDPVRYDQSLLYLHKDNRGLFSLPLVVYPSALEYNVALFDRAGLAYPPTSYGEKYTLPDGSQITWDWDAVARVARLLTLDVSGHNVSQLGFDSGHIVQYGFTWGNQDHPNEIGSYWGSGSLLMPGTLTASIPTPWKAGWQWTYAGLHGSRPFISANIAAFETGQAAMTVQTLAALDRFGRVATFQFAALPSYEGRVNGRITSVDFHVYKNAHPDSATYIPAKDFVVLTFLLEHASPEMVVGTIRQPATFAGIPVRLADRKAFFDLQKQKYPWVTSWDTLLAGLAYPDQPSAEGPMPNFGAVWMRLAVFGIRLKTNPGLDLAVEEIALERDLTVLFSQP